MKFTTIVAAVATALVAATLVNSVLNPQRKKDDRPKPKPPVKKKSISGQAACTIRRATFGGTESALLRVQKDGVMHYIVMDLPTDNPMAASYQSAWLDANYGSAEPAIVGVFPTVRAAVTTAANLCKRN